MAQYSVSRKDHFNAANSDLHEVMMLARKDGTVNNGANPAGMAVDAFGRARASTPLTLFDSTHRFADNDLFTEDATGDGAAAFDANEGLINMTVGTASGAEIIRETNKVFSYQPGKSLQNLNTFVFEPAKANLRQRVGYFGEKNGIYLELDGTDAYVVERSSVTGSTINTRIAQSDWNIDPLDGTGISGVTLDLSKAQVQFIDIEWIGTVRTGFLINGEYIHCHSFYHANTNSTTHITTASLPIRYELTNTGLTATASTMKQICSTVISEGGYELRGRQQAVETPISTPRDLTVAATYYPVISIRLKSTPDRLDAIVILTALSIMGVGNNAFFNWRVVAGGDTTGGTWTSAGGNSAVEYNIGGTSFSFTGSRTLASGFISSTTQATSPINILKEALFKFQLERDTFAPKAEELTLVVAAKTAGDDVYASLDWEEITR